MLKGHFVYMKSGMVNFNVYITVLREGDLADIINTEQ